MNALILGVAVAMSFTSPPQIVDGYIGYRSFDHGQTWERGRMWSDSLFTIPFVGGPPSTRLHFFMWTDTPNRTDELFCISAYNLAGYSPASNRCLIATGLKDTCQFLWRPDMGTEVYTEPQLPLSGTAAWNLAVGDSASFEVVRETTVQLLLCHRIMELYRDALGPYWIGPDGTRWRTCP